MLPASSPGVIACPRNPSGNGRRWRRRAPSQSRQVSSLEVVRAHIERMRSVNPAVNAVVADLGAEARKGGSCRGQGGRHAPAARRLHGVPVTVKENVDVKGHANPNGIPAFAG